MVDEGWRDAPGPTLPQLWFLMGAGTNAAFAQVAPNKRNVRRKQNTYHWLLGACYAVHRDDVFVVNPLLSGF